MRTICALAFLGALPVASAADAGAQAQALRGGFLSHDSEPAPRTRRQLQTSNSCRWAYDGECVRFVDALLLPRA